MRHFKKTITLLLTTAVLFTGKTLLDLNTLGNEVEALSNQVEQIQAEQSRKPEVTITAMIITPTPTEAPEPEPAAKIYDIPLNEELQTYTFNLCKENDLDYETILAMMDQESDYREKVISKTNDYGIMQINKVNHEWLKEELGIEDFLDAEQNILAAIRILSELTEKYKDPHQVLMAYNCGEAGAKKLWKQGKTTSEYSREIIARAEELREEGR